MAPGEEWEAVYLDGDQVWEISSDDGLKPMEQEEPDLQQLRQKLANQLQGLQQAVTAAATVTGEVAKDCSSSSSTPLPAVRSEFLPAQEHYLQALEQARELYSLTDPEVTPRSAEKAAVGAAQKDTLAEAIKLYQTVRQEQWPQGWGEIMGQAVACFQADQGKSLQYGCTVKEMPPARRTRATRAKAKPVQTKGVHIKEEPIYDPGGPTKTGDLNLEN